MNISVNAAPVADNDTDAITEGASNATGNVITNDSDSDDLSSVLRINGVKSGAESSSLTNRNVGKTIQGRYGAFRLNSNGTYAYRVIGNAATEALSAGQQVTDVFSYKVIDDETNAGSKAFDIAQITFTITGINDAPVASNDSNTIDISTDSTITVTDGSVKDVLVNDSDKDRNNTITVTEIRTGALEGSGTSGVVGSTLKGEYGTLIINANGSYTYIVNNGLDDLLDKGQIVFEYFNYTVSDGTASDTGSIIIKLQNGGQVVKDIRDKKAERLIKKESKRNEKSNRTELKIPKIKNKFDLDLNKLEIPKQDKKSNFSQGLRLTDLVAETNSIVLKEKLKDVPDVFADKVKVKEKNDSLNLKFKIFNESDAEIVKYEGVMKDGSPLPDWIKVDPKTGVTTTNIPDGIENVEIIIIATDQQNERREIAVKIDPEQILKDKEIVKKAKKQNASIEVDNDGNVNLIKSKEDRANENISKNIFNFDNQSDIMDIIQSKKSDTLYTLKADQIDTSQIINLPNDISQNFERSKLVLEDGSEIPEWLEYDPKTGKIIADPPEDISKLDLKLIIEQDGEIIVKDLSIEFSDENTAQIEETDSLEVDNKFVSLNDQLDKEFTNWDDYGSNVINRL